MKLKEWQEKSPIKEAKVVFTWDEINNSLTKAGMSLRRIGDIRKALKSATGK